jgi:hypothetical protein
MHVSTAATDKSLTSEARGITGEGVEWFSVHHSLSTARHSAELFLPCKPTIIMEYLPALAAPPAP